MPAGDFRVQLKGLVEFHRALKEVQRPLLGRTVGQAMKDSMSRVIVPVIKAKTPVGPAPHTSAARGKRGRTGPLKRNVTVRQSQKRSRRDAREMAAVNAGPRAWYRHFVIQGTERHSLAKGSRRDKGIGQHLPPIHPGSHDNDFVAEAVTGRAAAVAQAMGDAVIRRVAQALKP